MTSTQAPKAPQRESIFRGQSGVIFGCAVLAATLTGPGQTIGVSVFIDHFVDELSFGTTDPDRKRELVSTAYLIGTLTGSFFLPFVGRFIDRRGVRHAQLIIGVLFAAALVNMSFVQGFVTLAIGFIGIRLLGQGSLSLASTVTVSLRFNENRGTALGLFSMLTAGLMALVPIGLAALISQVGWRSTWLIAAVIIAATVSPLAWFGLRSMPRSSEQHESEKVVLEDEADSFTRGEALRSRAFWILASISSAAGMLSTALNFHQIDLLQDAGLSETAAAGMFLPQVLGSTVAGLLFGTTLDRVGSRYLPAISISLLGLAHVLAAVAAPGLSVITYAIVLGAAGGSIRTVTSALLPAWFGTKHLGSIQGTLTFINVVGSAIGPVALALLQSSMGSYPPAIMLLATIPAAVLVFALLPPFSKTDASAEDRANLS